MLKNEGVYYLVGLPLLTAHFIGWYRHDHATVRIVGIDLGTTFSVAATKLGNITTVIPDNMTKRLLLPSVVSFSDDGKVLVGHDAADTRSRQPQRTIFNSKRFIGRTMKEAVHLTNEFPFRIGTDVMDGRSKEDSVAGFYIPSEDENDASFRWVSPVQVAYHIISRLNQSIQSHFGYSIPKANICVPASFNNSQVDATKAAFELAGFQVANILTEPTAAALAYNLHMSDGVRNVLVYDMGGGTLDISLLYINGLNINILGVAGDEHLGGADFDLRMLKLIEVQLAKDKGQLPCHRATLHAISEEAKIALTDAERTLVQCISPNGTVRRTAVMRNKFEEASADLYARAIEPVRRALSDQWMTPNHVDDVVLVGGATRMPKVRQLLRDFFGPEKAIHTEIDPDITVAVGAANLQDGSVR